MDYTFKHLLADLQRLSKSELSQPANTISEYGDGKAIRLWVVDEDYINPSGDGIEPASAYAEDEFFDVKSEHVVVKKGTVLLELRASGSAVVAQNRWSRLCLTNTQD